ncbi:MAG TPA: type II toxin-antitoxin system PemK/MazF family toxin [Tepidisphaeraceae bacterium]|nr:type II toxin-antitoxin system PemK/MazF family toxin [Tepidisphaeraceae bacterium]
MAFPHRGEIWSVEFPDDPKSRPALIISPDARNEFANSVLAIPITSNLRPLATHLLLPAGQGGLSQNSMARCENVSYVHKSRLHRGPYSGTISPALMREIERCVLRTLGMAI